MLRLQATPRASTLASLEVNLLSEANGRDRPSFIRGWLLPPISHPRPSTPTGGHRGELSPSSCFTIADFCLPLLLTKHELQNGGSPSVCLLLGCCASPLTSRCHTNDKQESPTWRCRVCFHAVRTSQIPTESLGKMGTVGNLHFIFFF